MRKCCSVTQVGFEPPSAYEKRFANLILRYYMLNGEKIAAFPPGFQMISGDTLRRNSTLPPTPNPDAPNTNSLQPDDTSQSTLRQKAVGFNCLHYQSTPEGSLQRHGLPSKEYMDANCNDGMRLELMFPSCWNGKDADSPDHQSHLAFPDGVMSGNCPQGFDQRIPSMFYETIFNTAAYKGKSGQFILANGDPHGYGYHGDFVSLRALNRFDSADQGFRLPDGTNLSYRMLSIRAQTLQEGFKTAHPSISRTNQMPANASSLSPKRLRRLTTWTLIVDYQAGFRSKVALNLRLNSLCH